MYATAGSLYIGKGVVLVARWLIRITGNRRREVDLDLVVQAVIALGHQLAQETRLDANAKPDATTAPSITSTARGEVAS